MENKKKPNILFITTDQQRYDTLSSLVGNTEIFTPHLDWLVDRGVAFTQAYTDCPICMAARTTMMTGRHGYESGVVENNGMPEAVAGHPTLADLMTKAGYQTRAQGKMHFEPMRCNYGFETMELPMDYYIQMHRRGGSLPKEHGVGENEMTPVISTVNEQDSLTHWTIQRSIDFLETRDETRPFFLWTSFTKPHPPFDPCANYWALYQNRDVSAPIHGDWSEKLETIPQGFMKSTYCLNNAYRMSDDQLKDSKRAYYACITQIDYQLGLLFARMREMELLDNTWIIFTTDHGEMLGDHHMGAKCVFLEGSAHIPMIVCPPGNIAQEKSLVGKKIDTLAQTADIMPTILNIAGVDVPEYCAGMDLLELGEKNRPFYGVCGDSQFAVMRDKLKLCYTIIGGGELLFDLNNDPHELNNLIDNPEYKEQLAALRCELRENLAKYSPELIEGGEIKTQPPIESPESVSKWPGFHSTTYPSDLLH